MDDDLHDVADLHPTRPVGGPPCCAITARRLDETVEAFAAVMPGAEAADLLRNLCSQSEAAGHSIN